jgi:lipoprotein NlpI
LDAAIADCDRAIALDPKNISACITCGSTKGIKGDVVGAIADYNLAIALDPKDARGYRGRASIKRLKGDFDGALADCDKTLELNPKDLDVYYNRALIRYDKHDWSNAVSDLRKAPAIKFTNSKSDALQDYSRIFMWMARARLGERNAATDALKEYLLTRSVGKPGDWPSTIVRFLTGDVSEADFLKVADNGDEKQIIGQRAEAYFYAGTVRLLDNDKSTAAGLFKKCLETGARNLGVYPTAAAELEALKK